MEDPQLTLLRQKHHRQVLCPSREGWGPISRERDFDFTLCFENGPLLLAPLAVFAIVSVWRCAVLGTREKVVAEAGRKARLRLGGKLLLFGLLLLTHALHLIHLLSTLRSPITSIQTYTCLLSLLSLALAALLSSLNHTRSPIPSTTLLLFFPLYLLALAVRLRTLVVLGYPRSETREFVVVVVELALTFAVWLAECAGPGEGARMAEEGKVREEGEGLESPLSSANIYSRLTFDWLTPLLQEGRKRFITEEDLWAIQDSDQADALGQRLERKWNAQQRSGSPSLWVALFKAYGGPYFLAAVFKAIQDLLAFAQPQLLRLLLQFVNSYKTDTPEPPIRGYVLALVMFLSALAQTTFLHQYFQLAFLTGMRVRAGLVYLLYKKSLNLSNEERAERSTGDIVNLMSVDANRLMDLCTYGQITWSGPLQIIIAFVSLYNLLGWQAFVGVGVMIVSMPISTMIARLTKKLAVTQMKNKDRRTRTMNELLSNIKSIKLFAWEDSFAQRLLHIRNDQELKMLRKIGVVNSVSNFVWSVTPFLVSFASFAVYSATSPTPLTSDIIFPALSIFSLLSFPLFMIANILSSVIESTVSVERLKSFLNASELQPDAKQQVVPSKTEAPVEGEEVVRVSHGEFTWSRKEGTPTLHDINLSITMGELVALLGRVGDGKTSLISAILGEMYKLQGDVSIKGSVAYYSQSPWIMGDTVRGNIIFGHKFDQRFYDTVLDACALRPDLAMLPQGDMTEVGEKGITLSGGQRARVALARAVYSRADVYLLDDPLCAVDSHVAKHLWSNVIGPKGLLKGKARIISTNTTSFLRDCDSIVMLRRGIILEQGSYQEAMERQGDLHKLVNGLGKTRSGNDSSSGSNTPSAATLVNGDESDTAVVEEDDTVMDNATFDQRGEMLQEKRERRISLSMRRASVLSIGKSRKEALRAMRESTAPKEAMNQGKIKLDVYKKYIGASSASGVLLFMLATALTQAFSILGNVVLRSWGEANREGEANDTKFLLVYFLFGMSSSAMMMTAGVLLYVVCAIRCSKKLHDNMFHSIMRAPLGWFERTPIGRILNLFSRDIYVIDEVLVRTFSGFFRTVSSVIGVIIVIGSSLPPFLAFTIPIFVVYRWIMRIYLATSRELKRLDAVTKSPIFSWFQESLGGLSTIRAYNQQHRFIASSTVRLDRNQMAYLPAITINRWLAVRLELLGNCVILATAILAVSLVHTSASLDAGLVGLCISYALQITGSLNWVVRSASEVEQNIVSVERVLEMSKLEPEAPAILEDSRPAPDWPRTGTLEFDHYGTRYRPDLDLVLKDLTFRINSGEKIGVVGRTGAGKSSLTLALFRIIEAAEGRIILDGQDISKIGLKDLRSRLAIIPQDAQLFEASLRENLDPTAEHSDEQMWRALEAAHLKEHVVKMGGLDAEVAEGGSNLSSGQRQLLGIARALLRKTKLLLLDEATSAIDLETDDAIQAIVRGPEFKDVTTLTIAHRLNTIADSTRILVMHEGRVAEFDTPDNLLANKDSIYYSLAKEAGLA